MLVVWGSRARRRRSPLLGADLIPADIDRRRLSKVPRAASLIRYRRPASAVCCWGRGEGFFS